MDAVYNRNIAGDSWNMDPEPSRRGSDRTCAPVWTAGGSDRYRGHPVLCKNGALYRLRPHIIADFRNFKRDGRRHASGVSGSGKHSGRGSVSTVVSGPLHFQTGHPAPHSEIPESLQLLSDAGTEYSGADSGSADAVQSCGSVSIPGYDHWLLSGIARHRQHCAGIQWKKG